jgi:hypothetical protein
VDRVFDAASNSFRVQLSLPNADHRLPAGLRCKADLTARAEPAADELKLAPTMAWPPKPATQKSGKP